MLLSTAGLLVRSFWGLLNVPLGFDPHNVTVVRTRLPYPNEVKEDLYPTAADEATFVRDVLRRTRALPGVDEVALGSGAAVPLDHPYQDQTVTRVRIEGDVSHGDQPLFAHRARRSRPTTFASSTCRSCAAGRSRSSIPETNRPWP